VLLVQMRHGGRRRAANTAGVRVRCSDQGNNTRQRAKMTDVFSDGHKLVRRKGAGASRGRRFRCLGLRQNAKARRTDATAMICCLTLSSPGNTLRMRLFHNHETAHMAALLRPSCSKVTKNRICRSLGIIWLVFRESFDKFSKLFRLPKAASLDLLLSVIVCRYNAAQKA
jgi:hypothetical protein